MNKSKYIYFILVTFLIFKFFSEKAWTRPFALDHDTGCYYSYLPAYFILHDLSLKSFESIPDEEKIRYSWAFPHESGNRVIKMTCGVALMQTPFFLIGHLYALNSNFIKDGFSYPYIISVYFSGLFFMIAGLWVLRKILVKYFDDTVVAITLVCILLGTNTFYYSIYEAGMSHAYSFFLISAFVYHTITYYESSNYKNLVIAGIAIGMAFLIRPTSIIFGLFFIFYDLKSIKDLSERIKFLLKNYIHVFVLVILVILPFFIQMMYWKYTTGSFLHYSYGTEKFYFNNPHLLLAFFSYRKGWLLYSPLMIFSIIGFIYLWLNKERLQRFAIFIYLVFGIYTFVIFSWWSWWYGGSFGQRPMVDIYPFLSIPLAACIHALLESKFFKYILLTIFPALIILSLQQTWQYSKGIIHYDSMSKAIYWKVFMKDGWCENYDQLIEPPDYNKTYAGEDEDLYK